MAARAWAIGAQTLLLAAATGAGCAEPQSPPRAELPGSVSPRARPERDVGRMDPDTRLEAMSLLLQPSGTKKDREALAASLQDPTSPRYHRWLTPEQVAARFGAPPADVDRATRWLRGQGFDVLGTAPTGLRIFFSGTVDQVERAFATEVHRYAIRDEVHFAMAAPPSVPAELGSVVLGLHGADDFRPHPSYRPQGSNTYELSPTDFATIYDVAPLHAAGIDGTGQKIAVAGQTAIYPADVSSFRSTFGLPSAQQPTDLLVPNSGKAVVSMTDLVEAEIDVEWSGAVAPNADIVFVHTGDAPGYTVFDSVYYAIENAIAPVVSLSYGYCEYEATPSEAVFYDEMGDVAAMLGITVVASSGDDGPATCDYGGAEGTYGLSVDFPADIPTVVGVGGTDIIAQPAPMYFDANGYATSYIPETGWNDTSTSLRSGGPMAASGGGASNVFSKPYWQMGTTTGDGARDVPDVALSASSFTVPYVIVSNGHMLPVGGTSAAAPSFAGILALVNQAIGAPQPGLGNANPVLYALAQSVPAAFHDITQGDNIVPCKPGTPNCPTMPPYQYGYACKPGYDLVTGIGSIDAAKLVNAWKSLTPTATTLTATAQGTTEGSPLELDATITSNATAAPMTGSVTFFYYTVYSGGGIDLAGPLGTVPVTPVTMPTQGATATLMTHAPPGLSGQAEVVAFYGGDANYLASWSAMQAVSATSTLSIVPSTVTAMPGQTVQFAAMGGEAPYVWTFGTSNANTTSSIDSATGLFQASSTAGEQDSILVVDAYGAEAVATVNIAGTGPADGGPLQDAGDGEDGGLDAAAKDSGPPPKDAAADEGADASPGRSPPPPSGSPGCSCEAAGSAGGSSPVEWAWAALGGFGTAWARARRRRARR